MNIVTRFRARIGRMSLKTKLPASFGGVALLTMLVLGAILVPLLSNYYSRSETSYLKAGAEQAAQDLAGVDWTSVAAEVSAAGGATAGGGSATKVAAARRQVQAVALSTQLRIRVFGPEGTLLVDSGPVAGIDATGIVGDQDDGLDDEAEESERRGEGKGKHGLPSPLGQGIFGGGRSGDGPRSDRAIETQLTDNGQAVAIVRLSEGPAYSSTA